MSAQKKSTKTRLIEAALDLFAERGVTETTTKAVAERAEVNEVTLFRHFGNKHGLLLAVMEDAAVFARLGKALVEQAGCKESISHLLKDYAKVSLEALERVPELVRSVLGEAGQYPVENRLAIGKGFAQANTYIAEHLAKVIEKEGLQSRFPPEKLASLLNELLLGYFIINSISEGDVFWQGQDDFLESLMELFLQGAILSPTTTSVLKAYSPQVVTVTDLPANLVHSILQKAKKLGRQEYAIAYVLFAAGLLPQEITELKRSHLIEQSQQHLLQINNRQVPLNQWIMGTRYGSSKNNPLTQWLKNRKDLQATLFINQQEQPWSETNLEALWQTITEGLVTPQGLSPTIEQAHQTWGVEMLTRGMEIEDFSILSGIKVEDLEPYTRRIKEKLAIEQAKLLDQKSN